MRRIAIFVLSSILAGCAAQRPQMTRDEYLQMTQRTYEGKTPDDVFRAAERLFRLADGDDFQFFHDANSITASRPWLVYIVLAATTGSDTWRVTAVPTEAGVKVAASLNTTMGSILPVPTTGGDMSVSGMPAGGGNVAGTAIYDVFWARMDYLLGASAAWMTCEEADNRVKAGITWGSNEALCNSFNVKDDIPEELVGIVQKRRPSSPSGDARAAK